jgi:predicted adenine nucleotide alpha hydrolase (AANH) superfamily ATPase
MTHKETIERNIGLTFDFVNYLIDNKSEVEKLPDNFNLKFIEKDFSKRQSLQKISKKPYLQERYVRVKNSFAMA